MLPNPGGIALDKAGNIYLSHFPTSARNKDTNPDRLTVYAPSGKLLHEWGKTGTGPGEFNYPGGMAIATDGRVYIADQTNHRMQMLDPNGRFLVAWGKYGTKPGEFGGNTNPGHGPEAPISSRSTSRATSTRPKPWTAACRNSLAEGTFLLGFGTLEDRPGSFGREFEPL